MAIQSKPLPEALHLLHARWYKGWWHLVAAGARQARARQAEAVGIRWRQRYG